jgi:hypothetical protein
MAKLLSQISADWRRMPSAPCGQQPELRLYFPTLSRWAVGKTEQLSSRVPRHVGVAIKPLALQAGGPGLPIPGLFRHNTRRLGEHDESKAKERHASIEGCHSSHPLGARKPILRCQMERNTLTGPPGRGEQRRSAHSVRPRDVFLEPMKDQHFRPRCAEGGANPQLEGPRRAL